MKNLDSNNFFDRFSRSPAAVLPRATIGESHNGIVEFADLESGLTLLIPSFTEMEIGDGFHLSMSGGGTNYGRLGEVLAGYQASIFVPPEAALEFANACVHVSYNYFAYPDDQAAATAFEIAMPYRPVALPLAVDGHLPYITLSEPVTAVIEPWVGMAEADVITFYAVASYGGTVWVEHREVVHEDLGKTTIFELPPNFLKLAQTGMLHVFYSVLTLGRETWSPSSLCSLGAEIEPLKVNGVAPSRRSIVVQESQIEIELSGYSDVEAGDHVLLACLAEEFNYHPQSANVFYRHIVQADALQEPIRFSFPIELFKYDIFETFAIVERANGTTSASIGYRYFLPGLANQ